MTKRYLIDVAFEFQTKDEDPLTLENLPALVEAARVRLDSILENNDVESFDVYDVYDDPFGDAEEESE